MLMTMLLAVGSDGFAMAPKLPLQLHFTASLDSSVLPK
jgi:hypothetical protein